MSPPFTARGGFCLRTRRTAVSEPAPRRTRPARSSRPSGSPYALTTGSSRATGRLRSMMRIVSPFRTLSIMALKLFFIWDIVATFRRTY